MKRWFWHPVIGTNVDKVQMGELFGKVVKRHPELALIAHSGRIASTLIGKQEYLSWQPENSGDYVWKLTQHWVTWPEISFETDTETFFWTKYFLDRYRDFFSRPNVFETDTETFFRDQMFSRPIPRLFWDQIFSRLIPRLLLKLKSKMAA